MIIEILELQYEQVEIYWRPQCCRDP